MSTELPLHHGAGADRAHEPRFSATRLFPSLHLKSAPSFSRRSIFVIGGICFLVWLSITQVGSRPFFGGPFQVPPYRPSPPRLKPLFADDIWASRAEKVKESFLHAYHDYLQYASPRDELLPLTNGSIDNFNGWGVTTVDSLDTMYLMGLHDEFDRGIKLVERMSFVTDKTTTVPFFETVIRYLGGLLSAYGLSKDPALLQKADELGAALLPAFNTSSGFPVYAVNTATKEPSVGSATRTTGWLAEIATFMMEYKYLAKITGKKEYYDVANTVMRRLYDADVSKYPDGLLPSLWSLSSGQPVNDQITIGAMADSAYEYVLKQYLLTNQSEPESLQLYLRTMRGIINHNLFLSPTRSLLYVTDISANSGTPSRRFEHLSCFLPGLFALGVSQLPPSAFAPFSDEVEEGSVPSELERHLWAAEGLAISCGTIYSDMPTGLGADEVTVITATDIERERRKGVNKRRTPPLPSENFSGVRPRANVAKPISVNQTAEDIKSNWGNVIRAWREGRYDGETDAYVELEEDNRIFGNMSDDYSSTSRTEIGPVPGVRDPPRAMADNSDIGRNYRGYNPSYQLRPETIESFFVLWRTTGDEVWRERGWAAFTAIQKYLRTPSGFATANDVFSLNPILQDSMPSFFLAETLKYLYLLFSDEALLPLDKYVLNTEAHPLPVFSWTDAEKKKFVMVS